MDILKSGASALGIDLTPEQLASFKIYYQELIEWNRKLNLTTITNFDEVQNKHFLDSLTPAPVISFKNKPLVIDIGTGAGFPGIPLKITFPDIRLTLLEATAKKVKFLEHIVQKLNLKDVEVVNGRAEEAAHNQLYREIFDVVLSRAVSTLPVLAELALPFCRTYGIFIAYKKGDISDEVKQAEKAITLMGGKLKDITPADPSNLGDNRVLVVVEKISPSPMKYPRRPGMPEKRPILS